MAGLLALTCSEVLPRLLPADRLLLSTEPRTLEEDCQLCHPGKCKSDIIQKFHYDGKVANHVADIFFGKVISHLNACIYSVREIDNILLCSL